MWRGVTGKMVVGLVGVFGLVEGCSHVMESRKLFLKSVSDHF